MSCYEFQARLHPYIDGELTVTESAAAESHRSQCEQCAGLAAREREFCRLLRRQPREGAPAELRERIVHGIRREHRRSAWRPRLVAPGLAAVAAAVVLVLLAAWPTPPPLVAELVDKHIAYAQLALPAELPSGDRVEVAEWFLERAGMRVTVPDYSLSGIQLVGARLADAHERRAAYLLYEKGRTLLSVFMVPLPAEEAELRGARVSYGGYQYLTHERKGYRTVSWSDGQTLYGLVSALDYDALLECADRLRRERAQQTRL